MGSVVTWIVSHKYDPDGARLADGHYSRRSIGAPPVHAARRNNRAGHARTRCGMGLVATASDRWHHRHERTRRLDVQHLSQYGGRLSSDLVLEAENVLADATKRGDTAGPCGPDGLLTYVWPRKIQSTNPGWCFQVVGWTRDRWTKKGKRLLRKPFALCGVSASAWNAIPIIDESFGWDPT